MKNSWILGSALALLCACSRAVDPGAGSQTHFLSRCSASCPVPYTCACGVCTRECSDASSCKSEASAAVCVAASSGTDMCTGHADVCDVECKVSSDCRTLGSAYTCTAGRCRGPAGSATDAGTQATAGSSGSVAAGSGTAGRSGAGASATSGAGGSGVGGMAGTAGTTAAANCKTSADCVLIAAGCCGACVPTKEDVLAVPKAESAAATQRACPMGPVNCGPCAPDIYEPTRAAVRAACVAGQCSVIDLREQPESTCQRDADCHLAEQGCCGSCGPNPSGWIALNNATMMDPYALVCDPIPPCIACTDTKKPEAFCAPDGHCAAREIPRVRGNPSTTCFSPSQHLEQAYNDGQQGCDCFLSGATVCAPDATNHGVSLVCSGQDAYWMAASQPSCMLQM